MYIKSLFSSSRGDRARQDAGAGVIVLLMMALVFVPIMATHAALAWQERLADIGPQQLAAIVNMIVPAF